MGIFRIWKQYHGVQIAERRLPDAVTWMVQHAVPKPRLVPDPKATLYRTQIAGGEPYAMASMYGEEMLHVVVYGS